MEMDKKSRGPDVISTQESWGIIDRLIVLILEKNLSFILVITLSTDTPIVIL